ncbi:lon protease homolog 2, peroxisomal-like [Lytechinus variegatus]|uniref:lon protease homolog 2, peroxisomal-like n=1 Tax=Lytechinus variegatus TaxID=7654 RepID=UPI001BB0DB3B|nr:lon protease homolog 2, peroxisomal-like [Lytechinus variegatus]
MSDSKGLSIPRRLPLLLVADAVLLPGASMRIPVNNPTNMNMVKSHILRHNTLTSTVIGVIPKNPDKEEVLDNMHTIGTAGVVVQVTGTNWPRPAYTLLVTGLCRFKVNRLIQEEPYPVAQVEQLDKLPGDVAFLEADAGALPVADDFREQATKLLELLDITTPVVAKLKRLLDSLPITRLPDIFASIVQASYNEKLEVLDAVDLEERFQKTLPLLARQIEGLRLLGHAKRGSGNNIRIPAALKENKNNRVVILKNGPGKPRFIDRQERSNDSESDGDEISELERKIKDAQMPKHAQKACQKELKRLKKMPSAMPEYAMTRNYLELMSELPWSKQSKDTLDIKQARIDLDADHYGLDKLKKRVIEYLAVRQLKNSLKGPILCFVGPPGVGKTSLGRSIAHTLGRAFHRISLGGCCDQSDIRGHRRTYIGSMPGRIIHGLKIVGVNNPVFLLDEIDKLGNSLQGDPASALLEVLDPEQNNAFTDHYLNVQFDLSQVLFIATANSLQTIPPALKDRMEVIQVPGYTQEEKFHIAKDHLIPKQLKEHGLSYEQLQFAEDATKYIISKYTREAGVRQLERKFGAVCRAVAVRVAETQMSKRKNSPGSSEEGAPDASMGDRDVKEDVKTEMTDETSLELTTEAAISHPPEMPIVIDVLAVKDILGAAIYESETCERLSQPGVAVGMAWTAMGGEIMYVEATKMDGDGELTLTGQLGDVMRESAQLALNWVRSNASKLAIDTKPSVDLMEGTDVHIHFPAGAVGKDGPSAGVTVVTVLVSLFSGRCVRSDTAMTGEITLRGLVLPVGGIKSKVLAAHRAGIKHIILPKRCEKDLEEIPNNIRNELTFTLATKLEDVLQNAFDGGFPSLEKPSDDIIPSKL